MRWFSLVVMTYMLLAITWWGVLLYQKNNDHYIEKKELLRYKSGTEDAFLQLENEKSRQSLMIIGEGVTLVLTLLAGLWIINRSALKEIANISAQNNFFLSVSHELKSPIASIKLALQTLQRQNISTPMRNNLLNKAVMDSDRLENLVQNVLLSVNINNKQFELFYENFDLIALIKELIVKMSSHDPDTTIHLNNSDEILLINADRSGITLILSNLIENGLKYSPDKKELWVEVTDMKSAKQFHVMIKDRGIGIEDHYKKEVFKRFYRVTDLNTRSQKGTGLGLFIAREIALAHKGAIEVTDNEPKGTIFTLTIPQRA